MLCKICIVQFQPRKDVLDHTDNTASTRQRELDHTDHTASTRQRELDHTDHTDHTDQGYICPERSRSCRGNRWSVRGVKILHEKRENVILTGNILC